MCKTIKEGLQQLYYWQYYEGEYRPDNYTSKLFELYAKADSENMQRLERIYPNELMAYKIWCLHAGEGLKECIEDLIKPDNDAWDMNCPVHMHSVLRIAHPMELIEMRKRLQKILVNEN